MVIREDNAALKVPLKLNTSSDDIIEANIGSIKGEQEIYKRLTGCDHVVKVLQFTETSTKMQLMENGDLLSYITRDSASHPSKQLMLRWFCQMARGLAEIHDRRVLVFDIAMRNFLLDSDLSIKFCDFTEATALPLDTDMEAANDHNSTVQTDIGELAAVMYEVVTGEGYNFNSFLNTGPSDGGLEWPDEGSLRPTEGIWLGDTFKKCWTRGKFRNARELLRELESVHVDVDLNVDLENGFAYPIPSPRMPVSSSIMSLLRQVRRNLSLRKMMALTGAVVVVTFIFSLKRSGYTFPMSSL
ncbi:kinase-like domain-containing protein [Aspergillus venezuelensis]